MIVIPTVLLFASFVFAPEDSGRVVEGRTFSGGVELTDWKVRGDGVWECPVSHRFVQLFVNGRRAARSPFPKKGFFHIGKASSVRDESAGGFIERSVFTNDSIRAALGSLSPEEIASVQYQLFHKWSCERRTLKGYDARANAVTAFSRKARPGWYRLESAANRSRVRFENVRTAFTEKGEWYYDDAASKVLYRPLDGEEPGKVRIVAPKEEIAVAVAGAKGRPVENLRFRNCVFEATKLADEDAADGFAQTYSHQAARGMTGAVELKYARNVTFENCIFRNTGGYGVRMREGSVSNTLVNCTLEDLGAGGVWAGPEKANPAYSMPEETRKWSNKLSEEFRPEVFDFSDDAVAFITVTNSTIRGAGRTNAEGVGVCFTHVSDSRVVHCDIHDLMYTGVSLGWIWGYYGSVAQRNEVAFCRIHDIGKGVMADMGGVYTLGTSHGTRIHDNVIHNVKSSSYGGWATYNDEGSEGVQWYNNLCYDCSSDLYHLHYGRHNTVRNSIFIADKNGNVAVSIPAKTCSAVFDANIFVSRGEGNAIRTDKPAAPLAVGTDNAVFTRNLWHKTDGDLYFGKFNEFWNWQHHGRDFDGAVGDPRFVDLENGDFRLLPDSPALKLGFRPFDYTRAGRKIPAAK